MKYAELPAKWKQKLAEHIRDELKQDREQLRAGDFLHHVMIVFQDGSHALFRYAFYVLDDESKEVAIFTEHCGYHIFPLLGTELELLESKWTDVGTP